VPAGCDAGPLRENADKDLLTAPRPRVAPNSSRREARSFMGPEMPKAPDQRQLTGASCRAPCGELPKAALRCIEELVPDFRISFACERARRDGAPIRRNQRRTRGKRGADKRMLVVRMHRGAHSRRESLRVKQKDWRAVAGHYRALTLSMRRSMKR
jgi:hypothetical protein